MWWLLSERFVSPLYFNIRIAVSIQGEKYFICAIDQLFAYHLKKKIKVFSFVVVGSNVFFFFFIATTV